MTRSLIDSLVGKLLNSIFDDDWVGKYGEDLTARKLKLTKALGRSGEILRNIYVPKENGQTSEIDLIFISQKGIFVLESKNYSGWIFGNEKDLYWTASLDRNQKNHFYNPISQNRNHMKWLRTLIGENVPLVSIIVFSDRCEFKSINTYSDVKVIHRKQLVGCIKGLWKSSPDTLTDDQIQTLYEKIKPFTEITKAKKEEHIQNIQDEYIAPTCPMCGKPLVVRTTKHGPNTGKKFWGCSGFPNCHYIKPLA